ncbi:MAG TPA: NDP-sugar synthase [Armatimonadaceae bacterium]|nr:NDP-sugar synthase [Armatimonadaceae bacterium]
MKAMVLAAGEGTRLRPLTEFCPKPMVPVANTPLLERTLALLAGQGFRDVAVNLYHRADVVRDALGDGSRLGVNLSYSDEEILMGTAGGVKRLEEHFSETFLVLYGDNLYRADFTALVERHRASGAAATIATFTAADPTACGLVETDARGRVRRFREKPPPEEVVTDQANAGVYVLEPEVFRFIPEGVPFDFGRDVFPAMLADGGCILQAFPLGGYLRDTGTLASYRQANWDVLEADGSPFLLGEGATVARGALLQGRCVLGRGVTVGAKARLRDCILWDGCAVAAGATLTGATLGSGCVVGVGATIEPGAVLGDGVRVADGAVVPEDARISGHETVTHP